MSRHRTFAISFGATVAVLVPAAWHGSDATIEKDGRRLRPLQKELYIDDTRVTLDVDRSLIRTGDKVTVTLHAYADTPKQVAVDMRVMQSDDTFGSRVAAPPHAIDLEHLTLAAAPDGGKGVKTLVAMKPNKGVDPIDYFRVIVGPKGFDADLYGGGDDEGDQPKTAQVPLIGVAASDFKIRIEPIGKPVAGKPFDVRVVATNATGNTLAHAPYIHLGTTVGLWGLEAGQDFEIEEAAAEDTGSDASDDTEAKGFARRASTETRYTVTPKVADLTSVTFVASAFVYADDMGTPAWSALDAQTIAVEPAPNADDVKPAVAEK